MEDWFRRQGHMVGSAPRFSGVCIGRVLTNHSMDDSLQPGEIRVSIPAINNSIYGPLPFEGATEPPVGTICLIGFSQLDEPVVVGYVGWGGMGLPLTVPDISGALSAVTDPAARAVLQSIINALVSLGIANDTTT